MNPVKVEKKNNYFTVVASEKIQKGAAILKLQGAVSSLPDKYSLQIGEEKHLYAFTDNPEDESSAFRFLNHSCSPNSCFDLPRGELIALNDIDPGQEILFHYCTTEYEMSAPFNCLCSSADCLNEIKGFRFLSQTHRENLTFQIAAHLKKINDKP